MMAEFEELAERQKRSGELLKSHLANMKKDGPSRRTAEWVTKQHSKLEERWKEFGAVHRTLTELNQPEHKYFTQDFFGQVQKIYTSAIEFLGRVTPTDPLGETANKQTGTDDFILEIDSTPLSTEEQEHRLRKQYTRIAMCQRIIREALSLESRSIAYYAFKVEEISGLWSKVVQLNEEIISFATRVDKTHSYFTNKEFESLETMYQEAMIKLHEKKEKITTEQEGIQDIKLPRIQIPTFDGSYKTWTSFHDIYMKIIHTNVKLGKAEKMQYLKTSLKGEAYKLIQHLISSEANYVTAWELLVSRYNNKRIMFSSHLDTLLNQPTISVESTSVLKTLHDTTRECIHAIQNLQIDVSSWSPLIAHIILKKVDKETQKLFEQSLKEPREPPQLEDVLSILESRFQTLEILGEAKKKPEIAPHNRANMTSRRTWPVKNYHAAIAKCKYCNDQHMIYSCAKFRALSVKERISFIRQNKICSNCLNHDIKEACHSHSRCVNCKQKHHSLLHQENDNVTKNKQATTLTSHITANTQQQQSVSDQSTSVLLATALVRVKTIRNNYELLRALIDPGSQATFISENAAQMLGLPRSKIHAKVSGMGQSNAGTSSSKIQLELSPRFPADFSIHCEALVLSSLTKAQPECHIRSIQELINIILADPTYDNPGPIDLLIGADVYGDILLDGIRKMENGILAQRTQFGWILSGRTQRKQGNCEQIVSMISRVDLDKQLKKFWEIEEIIPETTLTEEEKQCEEYYSRTVSRNSDGSYKVCIPFKCSEQQLGESRSRALARLYQMERRFVRDKSLKEQYNKFMREYLQLGHMTPVTYDPNSVTTNTYYLPHQAVIKAESSTTKLRVVFDASTKTTSGISLNDIMHSGPKLQQNLQHILLRWRKHQWVFTADIEKMYRQIQIAEEHQDFQRILWRFSTEEKIKEYKLTTVTYGTTSAPYLAIKTLHRLAIDEKAHHPEASEIILKDFYVDDLMSGSHSLQNAKLLQRELILVLKKGGFNLRKWRSNHKVLLDNVPEKLRDQEVIEVKEGDAIKTLGVHWSPTTDTFMFKVKLQPDPKEPTKRLIMSDIARLFDPLGWLSPVIIKAKILLQELWATGYEWDQPIEKEMAKKWNQFKNALPEVETISIPRWFHYTPCGRLLEIHGFCDASEKAYGAAIYSKITTEYGKTHIFLLTSKTKVAPLKKVTLPRLELCSAVLLAKLIDQTIKALGLGKVNIYAWTDSMIALGWINGKPEKWTTFVAHRVTEIQKLISPGQWNHVKSEENPADLASRGVDPQNLKQCALWWEGPSWLHMPKDMWPNTTQGKHDNHEMEEKRVLTSHVIAEASNEDLISRFSTMKKLIKVLAYCNRFISKCRKRSTEYGRELTAKEIQTTLQQVIVRTQKQVFSSEIKELQSRSHLSRKSSILSLNPFIDETGVMRVGGRIQNANIPYDEKHPIIIPPNHHLTKLLILEAHLATMHGGNETTLAFTRRKYWIINGKSKVKQELNKCVKCCRYKKKTINQMMGVLPAARVTPASPFTHTGIDYAGPIQIKTSKIRNSKCHKGYIIIFICLTTKAIHIESATDMTTQAFLAAFKRFTSRRGKPTCVYTDNGTTFVGAKRLLDNDLQEAIRQANEVGATLGSEGIQWLFIPPAAPHFGGIWEAGVKSIKYHLKRVIGDTALTFEELTTLLYQIEACLNSRPLYSLDNDPDNDILVLTPGHFLIGRAIVRPPESVNTEANSNILTRWKQIQKLTQDFWTIWQKEYLSRLQQRTKWQSGNYDIKVGQIVLIKDENCSPAHWPLARITQTHPGNDGVTRVVTLRYNGNNSVKRPVTKLCILPIDTDEGNSDGCKTTLSQVATVTSTARPIMNDRTAQHPLKGQFRPISASWSNYIASFKRKNKDTTYTKPSKLARLLLTTLIILGYPQQGMTEYTIKHPEPGLYIEHIGQAGLDRGTLRLELTFPFNHTAEVQRVNKVVQYMTNACTQSSRFEEETHCTKLLEHLEERKRNIINELEILKHKRRVKRGLFGRLLQYVFGVNDEIYTDLEHLEGNQELLRKLTNHQASIMLSTVEKINEAENQTSQKFNLITDKINQIVSEVNKIEGWYTKIDRNKVSIQVLSAYQLSIDLLESIERQYIKISEITMRKGSLLEIISPSKLRTVIKKASAKLPLNLEIQHEPKPRLEHLITDTSITIYGFLYITESDRYDLIKPTAIPKKTSNNTYVAPDISTAIIAVNYNNQRYFELTEQDFKACIALESQRVLCTPTVVSNIETNSNCVLDELYHRQNKQKCTLREFTVQKTLWKHLFRSNTWLFISSSPTTAAVKCSGQRQEVILESIGIIQIDQGCLVQTQKNILYSEIQRKLNVSTFFKKMDLNFKPIKSATSPEAPIEPILKTSDNYFNTPLSNYDPPTDSHWKRVGHHGATAITSVIITMIIIVIIWKFRKHSIRKLHLGKQKDMTTKESNASTQCKSTDFILRETPDHKPAPQVRTTPH